jgi:hypothetical protein
VLAVWITCRISTDDRSAPLDVVGLSGGRVLTWRQIELNNTNSCVVCCKVGNTPYTLTRFGMALCREFALNFNPLNAELNPI